jgi:hypothetical protein
MFGQPLSAAARFAGETLDQMVAGAQTYGREDLVARLGGARQLLSGSALMVYVVGEFKQGKSSLVNALLGTDVCPVDDDVATAVPTVLNYGENEGATAVYEPYNRDGGSGWTEDIALGDLPAYVSESGNPGNRKRLRSVHVAINRGLLSGGLTVVDTPGVGGLGSLGNAMTASELPRAHAVLMVSDASQELTEAEIRFARTAVELCPTVLFALTKIDLYPRWRRILELDVEHLGGVGVRPDVFAVSSRHRCDAVATSDEELNVESGFPPLIDRLRAVGADAERTALRAVGAHLRTAVTALRATVAAKAAALSDPERATELTAELARARDRADAVASQTARWQQILADGFADVAADLEYDLRARARRVLAEVDQLINQQDPVKTWADIEATLRARLSEVAVENYAEFAHATRDLAQRVGEHFELAEAQIVRIQVAAAPIEKVESLSMGTTTAPERGKLVTGITTLQQSYTGLMMFSMLRGLAALAIPTPVGLVAGLLMGGSGLAGARKQALEQRRAAARSNVRTFVDEYQQAVTKDARDAVRHAQRELRDRYGERAEELRRSAVEAFNAAQDAAASGQTEAEQLARVRQDLESISALRSRTEQLIERVPGPAPSLAGIR